MVDGGSLRAGEGLGVGVVLVVATVDLDGGWTWSSMGTLLVVERVDSVVLPWCLTVAGAWW
jgi:hypothetical protein